MAAQAISPDDLRYVTALLRASDRPRYYATLFAPRTLRADLFALYGFAAEIERVPDQVTDPTLGSIRLHWWRDSLQSGEAGGEGTPALRALHSVIDRHALPLAPLVSLIEARGADLYSDPPPTLADLEELLGKTQSSLFRLALIVAGGESGEADAAAHHAGLAYGLARKLAGFAVERARGRTFLPADLLTMEQLEPADVFKSPPPAGLQQIVAALGKLARHHLRAAREHLQRVPPPAQRIFLPLAIVEPLLGRIDQLDGDILLRPAALSDLEMLFRIGWGRLASRDTD